MIYFLSKYIYIPFDSLDSDSIIIRISVKDLQKHSIFSEFSYLGNGKNFVIFL